MALRFSEVASNINYPFMFVLLEDKICYDNDDYCVWGATLYNVRNNEIETYKYGHGGDLFCREDCVEYSNVINEYPELDLAIRKALVYKWFNSAKFIGEKLVYNLKDTKDDLNIPCTVVRGRKANGKCGYILYKEERINGYLAKRYGRGYANANSSEIGFVYIPEDNAVYEININYLEIDYDNAFNKTAQVIKDNIINNPIISTLSLAHLEAYAMSYSHIDYNNLNNKITSMIQDNYKAPDVNIPSNVRFVDAEKREAKLKAKQQKIYEEKLHNIIAWAKTIGKTPEEIKLIINRTMKKYNYLPCGVTEVDFTGIEI